MQTIIAKLTGTDADAAAFIKGGEILRDGGLVAFPTETVYGLGANALDAAAAAKIYAAKGRPSDNPLIVHLSDVADADKYCHTNEIFRRLAEAFMPGPITVVLPKKDNIPMAVTGGLDTVAIRVPSSPDARRLIEAAGVPVAAPSANISGKPSPTKAEHAIADMDGRIDMILAGGDCEVGVESTIVKIVDGRLILLRPGGITLEMLSKIGSIELDRAVTHRLAADERPEAPGMKYRHYAPDTRVVLVDGDDAKFFDFVAERARVEKVGIMIFDDEKPIYSSLPVTMVSIGVHSADGEAHDLFARLREMDSHHCDVFYVKVPDKSGIGLAIYNRMIKAAGHAIVHLTNLKRED